MDEFSHLLGAPDWGQPIAVLSRLSMLFWAECGQGATTLQGSHPRCTEICTYIVICRHTYGSTQKNWSVDVPPLEDR